MSRLKGKVAIVTGAAGGMGLATARLFVEEGAKVIATDIQAELLQKEIQAIGPDGTSLIGVVMDVASPEAWKEVVKTALDKFDKLDILVNNAGIFIPKGVLETETEDWDRILGINAAGVLWGMKAAIPAMQTNGSGSIINIASIAALTSGAGDGGGAAYGASKGAVRSMSRHAAMNYAKEKIRVNSIYPGPIYTPMVEKGGIPRDAVAEGLKAVCPLPPHIGDAIDIAYGVLYFASEESRFVTGAELVIDGGYMTQ